MFTNPIVIALLLWPSLLMTSLTTLSQLYTLPLFCYLKSVELSLNTNQNDDERRGKLEFDNFCVQTLHNITNYITVWLKMMHLYKIRPNNVFQVIRCCTRDEPLQLKFYPCSHFHGLKKFARMHYWQIFTFFHKEFKNKFLNNRRSLKCLGKFSWTMK